MSVFYTFRRVSKSRFMLVWIKNTLIACACNAFVHTLLLLCALFASLQLVRVHIHTCTHKGIYIHVHILTRPCLYSPHTSISPWVHVIAATLCPTTVASCSNFQALFRPRNRHFAVQQICCSASDCCCSMKSLIAAATCRLLQAGQMTNRCHLQQVTLYSSQVSAANAALTHKNINITFTYSFIK
jgi:hypothetical protein